MFCLRAISKRLIAVGLFLLALMSASPSQAGSGTLGDPFTNLSDAYSVSSGRYYFNLGSGTFQADVDNDEGGGWVLVLQYVHQGGTTPNKSYIGAGSDLPVTSSASLGADESADATRWGHADKTTMSQFSGDIELRWYGVTSNHSRVIHFRSTIGDEYVRTGLGNFSGISSDFSALTGHTANLPASTNNRYSNQQNDTLTAFPFYTTGSYHWGIDAVAARRWEVDDANNSTNTIHRVWVRSVETGRVVTNINDSGVGSLRSAIDYVNANASEDEVVFNIPGTGPHTITLSSALPAITDAGVTIDGTTQNGTQCNAVNQGVPHNLEVEVRGDGSLMSGFQPQAANVTLQGLSVTNFPMGAVLSNGSAISLTLSCSNIGVRADNITGSGNGGSVGIAVILYGMNATISNNVISGNNATNVYGLTAASSGAVITGNLIGLLPDGTTVSGNDASGILVSSTSDVRIGGTVATDRNVISGNGGPGIEITSSSNVEIYGNYVGLNTSGLAERGNQGVGVQSSSSNSLTIGDGSSGGRNIVAGNGDRAVRITGSQSTVAINGNYIGTDLTGNTALNNGVLRSAGSDDGIAIQGNVTDLMVSNNIIGGFRGESIEFWGSHASSNATLQGNNIGVGVDGTSNISLSNRNIGIVLVGGGHAANNLTIGGIAAGEGNKIANGNAFGIDIDTAAGTVTGQIIGNTIWGHGADGIYIDSSTADVAILQNSIYNNGGLGIDLNSNGVRLNDVGDGDGGTNEGLNFPVINSITTDGNTAIDFDFDLDVPAQPNGYRIEFFANSSADATGYGEGETYLGFYDTGNHPGGSVNYTGSFTASQSVSAGTIISATATRKTGTSTYDITSEFAQTSAAVSPLTVTNTNDSGAGSLRAAIEYANANAAADNITFNIPTAGPHVITVSSNLPDLVDEGIAIDGTTQTGASCGQLTAGTPHTLMIEIQGDATLTSSLLDVQAANVTLRGLAVGNAGDKGFFLRADNALVECSYWGVRTDGVTPIPLVQSTIRGATQMNGSNSIVRNNLISGNTDDADDIGFIIGGTSTNSVVQGNIIGLNASGTAALGNSDMGILLQAATTGTIQIGGTGSNERNVISGNGGIGIQVSNAVNTVNILGNYIGTGVDGMTGLGNGGDGLQIFNSTPVNIGDGTPAGRNIISGNAGSGVSVTGSSSNLTILDNYIGTQVNGTTALGNGANGITIQDGADINIGNGLSTGRNIISANDNSILAFGTLSNISVNGNYLNTTLSGNVNLPGTLDTIVITGAFTTIDILNNVIGSGAQDSIEIWGNHTGSDLTIQGNLIGVGADEVTNIGGGDVGIRIWSDFNLSNLTLGGATSNLANVIAHHTDSGIYIDGTVTGLVQGNDINSNGSDGVTLLNGAHVSLLSNTIWDNSGTGIDLGPNGVTPNDTNDPDTGPNDLLNFPVINSVTGDGTTSVTYDFNLDVPSNPTHGYRIEFFKNSTADPSGYGEGEIYLGFVDITHGGGDLNFTGTFTASEAVSVGNIISATTTRKTGASSYDATSEFAQNRTAVSPLVVTNTNDNGAGSLRAAITYANANASEDNITFDIPGAAGTVHTITLSSPLPTITDDNISIDGTTQSSAACGDLWGGTPHTLKIRLDGLGSVVESLVAASSGLTIQGLSITRFSNRAIRISVNSNDTKVQCSYLGLAPDETAAGNGEAIYDRGTGTLIGGLVAGEGNVISGNGRGIRSQVDATGVAYRGNFIGTDPSGLTAIANGQSGVTHSSGAATWSDITKNLISGNGSHGISLESGDIITGSSGDVVIAGNYIGTDRTGNTALANAGSGISFDSGSISGVTIGGTGGSPDRNVISGNTGHGLFMIGVSDIDILGNYIGLGTNGSAVVANGDQGIRATTGLSNISIGNGSSTGRNIISANVDQGAFLEGITALSILDNYFGTDVTGLLDRGNGNDAIRVRGASSLVQIHDNILSASKNTGDGTGYGLILQNSTEATALRNKIGVGSDGTTPLGNHSSGILLQNTATLVLGDGSVANSNIIAHNGGDGVQPQDTSQVAVLANKIFENSGLGIDLGINGVTANDPSDTDTGPNDLLNFPVINSISPNGTTVNYDVSLDVPSHGQGYRIDFFKNSSADPSGYGEGETPLGFVNVNGPGNHTGSFTATESVSQGDVITATTTRRTATGWDITSEFSLAYSAAASTELTASKAVSVFDPFAQGLYALPGNDIISSLTVTNPGFGSADTDSIVLIDAVPPEMTFYNGDMDDGGPATNPVYFTQVNGAGLSWTYATDVRYSNSPTRPANMAGCTYTPSPGYDANVTYVCLNPKGTMAAGDPDPSFTVQFRARIK